MKRIVIPAVFKAVCCLLILILLTIGFQIFGSARPHCFGKGLIHGHSTPDLWPFDRPMYSGW